MQSELEDVLKKLNLQEIELEDKTGQDKKQTDEQKGVQKKLDQANGQVNRMKQTNTELQQKISSYETQFKEQNREFDTVEREKRK